MQTKRASPSTLFLVNNRARFVRPCASSRAPSGTAGAVRSALEAAQSGACTEEERDDALVEQLVVLDKALLQALKQQQEAAAFAAAAAAGDDADGAQGESIAAPRAPQRRSSSSSAFAAPAGGNSLPRRSSATRLSELLPQEQAQQPPPGGLLLPALRGGVLRKSSQLGRTNNGGGGSGVGEPARPPAKAQSSSTAGHGRKAPSRSTSTISPVRSPSVMNLSMLGGAPPPAGADENVPASTSSSSFPALTNICATCGSPGRAGGPGGKRLPLQLCPGCRKVRNKNHLASCSAAEQAKNPRRPACLLASSKSGGRRRMSEETTLSDTAHARMHPLPSILFHPPAAAQVRYCSTVCQMAAWKSGHNLICEEGKRRMLPPPLKEQ